MVVTSFMLMTMFFAPALIASCTALRRAISPAPIVILPLRSRIVTPFLSRFLTSIRSLLSVSCRVFLGAGDPLAQRHQGASPRPGPVVNFVHEALHVEDAAAVGPQQVLRRQRVVDLGRIEPRPL